MPSSSLTFYWKRKQYREMKLRKFQRCWERFWDSDNGEEAPHRS